MKKIIAAALFSICIWGAGSPAASVFAANPDVPPTGARENEPEPEADEDTEKRMELEADGDTEKRTEPEADGDTEKRTEPEGGYTNPVLNQCADPDVLYHNGTYYLYCTTPTAEGNSGIKVYTSTDLVHWTGQGFAFSKGDGWGNSNFWAPDVIERDGAFYMYYTADEHLCAAVSDSPLGPFRQETFEPLHEYVREIDAHAFYDEASHKYYLYFVRFTAGNVIWGAELNDDMKSIKEETLTQIARANQGWDEDLMRVNEGPFMLVQDGMYYMTYSGSHFESIHYGVGYAVADHPLGPFIKYEGNPIMQSDERVHGAGHHCVTVSPDGKELFIVYHCHNSLYITDPRRLCIDRMQFVSDEDGNTVLQVDGPTVTSQAPVSGAVDADNLIGLVQPGSAPVVVTKPETAEEIVKRLPAEFLIRTSKNNSGTAAVAWELNHDTWEKALEDAAGKQMTLTVSGKAVLPEEVVNLGNIPLDVETQIIFDLTETAGRTKPEEPKENGGVMPLWVCAVLGIGAVAAGVLVKRRSLP